MWFQQLREHEGRVYSQNGEDGVIARIFEQIGTTNKFCVEFGVGALATECCTRRLVEQEGWDYLWMDRKGNNVGIIDRVQVTAANVNQLFKQHAVPRELDLLVIDVDGIDYWIWQALKYQPRVVVIEYNGYLPAHACRTVPNNPSFRHKRTTWYGASLGALIKLGCEKGYTLVYCEANGINAFFISSRIVPLEQAAPLETLYRPVRVPVFPVDLESQWVEV